MSIYARKFARSSRFPCLWPSPPHRARPLPAPPALFLLPPSSLPGLTRQCPVSSPSLPLKEGDVPLSKLKRGGLHEIKPEAYGDKPAALAFALAIVAEQAAAQGMRRDLLLWCLTKKAALEWGRPYGPGLIASGLDPALALMVVARNEDDAAWALEEGLKSRALIAALAEIEIKTPLAARRLSLAAQASRTPCLLLSSHSQRKSSRNRHHLAHRRAEERVRFLRHDGARGPFLATHAGTVPGRSAGAEFNRGVQS